MVIGETPTRYEAEYGEAYQSKAGQLLVEELESVGISARDTYYTTMVKCRTPEARPPTRQELVECRHYLLEEIEAVQPRFVLLLGATAAKLINKGKVTSTHGKAFEKGGITYFVTFNPAAALRDPARLPIIRSDLRLFANLVQGKSEDDEFQWDIVDKNSLDRFLSEFQDARAFSFDLETSQLEPKLPGAAIRCMGLGLSTGTNWVIPLEVEHSPFKSREAQEDLIKLLVELSKGKTCIAQNGKFDNKWLYSEYGTRFYRTDDTIVLAHLVDENQPLNLETQAQIHLGAQSYDIPLKEKTQWEHSKRRLEYCARDCYYTLKLKDVLIEKVRKEPHTLRLYRKLMMPVSRMFEDVELNGLYVDRDKKEQVRTILKAEMNRTLVQLNKLAGKTINWNSPAQIGKLLFGDLGIPALVKTDKGAPSTAESVLKDIEHPITDLLMKYRELGKMVSTYIDGWDDFMDGPHLYLSTNITGTVTGRFSSRLHQVPRDKRIRNLITAPPGWVHVCADYAQQELRIAAQLSRDPSMLFIFQTGGDIHTLTASEVLGSPSPTDEQRKSAKAVNFGFIYGMWWKKFKQYAKDKYGVILTDAESAAYREAFFRKYSALPNWHKKQKRLVNMDGKVINLAGRTRHLPGVWSSDKSVQQEAERQAINSPVQGFGGDLKAMGMVEIHETFSRDVLRLTGEVHDSILMVIKEDHLDIALPKVKSIMEHPKLLDELGITLDVPILVDIEVGPWGTKQKWVPKLV